MSKKTGYLVGGLVLMGMGALLYYENFKKFVATYTVNFSKISIDWAATRAKLFTQLVFNLTLNINNPTSFKGKITAVRLTLLFNGNPLAQVTKSDPLDLLPNTITQLPFSVGVYTTQIWGNVTAAYNALMQRQPITLKVTGTIVTDSGAITINQDITT